jgi:hypothetical protein
MSRSFRGSAVKTLWLASEVLLLLLVLPEAEYSTGTVPEYFGGGQAGGVASYVPEFLCAVEIGQLGSQTNSHPNICAYTVPLMYASTSCKLGGLHLVIRTYRTSRKRS